MANGRILEVSILSALVIPRWIIFDCGTDVGGIFVIHGEYWLCCPHAVHGDIQCGCVSARRTRPGWVPRKSCFNSSDKSFNGFKPAAGVCTPLDTHLPVMICSAAPADAGISSAVSHSGVLVCRARPANQSTTYSPPGPNVQSGSACCRNGWRGLPMSPIWLCDGRIRVVDCFCPNFWPMRGRRYEAECTFIVQDSFPAVWCHPWRPSPAFIHICLLPYSTVQVQILEPFRKESVWYIILT